MESGSDDEFFDATEDVSPVKSADSGVENKKSISVLTDDDSVASVSKLKETETVTNSHLESERDDMIMKDTEIARVQNEITEINVKNESNISTNNIISSDIKNKNELNQEKLETETTLDNNDEIIQTQSEIPEVPVTTDITPPPPVAPPRRKRKQKKDVKQVATVKEGADLDDEVNKLNQENLNLLNAPCIKVSLSTNEMSRVLESGNSLEVVFNDDLITRKSGGLSNSSPGSPAISKANLVRCNSISGRPLTDAEILEQVVIKNLDTGESIPLSVAEEKLPECTNPLALHILRIATEKNSDVDLGVEEEDGHLSDTSSIASGKMQDKRKKLKKFFGKTVQKIRSVTDQGRRVEESSSEDEEQQLDDGGYIKFKNHRAMKDRLMFNKTKLLQDLSGEHIGAVWTMKFSLCGKLLATAGQDNVVRVWVLKESASNFEEMRLKYSRPTGRSSPTDSMTSGTSTTSTDDDPLIEDLLLAHGGDDDTDHGPFRKVPFVSYHGHTSDVLDLSWSKNYFLLSSSMDKTVRLWHISRQECLCCFQHVDFVTAICFHPRDDRYFLSGSLDGKIRLWNIPEKKVALWNEIDGSGTSLVTAANFCQNGKLAVVGTYDGRCIFYDTERLKYHTQVTVRSSRGKNARGRKISGIEPMPGEDKVLITSNDSRIRLYDLKDHSLYCKYKGLQNESSQIKASFSHDGKMILCGSEDKFVYIWRTHHDVMNVRKDRNEYYESFSAHDAVVTAAIFAPFPTVIIENPSSESSKEDTNSTQLPQKPFEVLVSADWQGGVKLYINR